MVIKNRLKSPKIMIILHISSNNYVLEFYYGVDLPVIHNSN
jgi:hypothetical protein